MTEYDKMRALHEINGEISVLVMQRDYLSSLVNKGIPDGIPEITQIEVDESTILQWEYCMKQEWSYEIRDYQVKCRGKFYCLW